jgi:hypothetical protein
MAFLFWCVLIPTTLPSSPNRFARDGTRLHATRILRETETWRVVARRLSSTGVLDQVGDGFHSTSIHKDYVASLKIADVLLALA